MEYAPTSSAILRWGWVLSALLLLLAGVLWGISSHMVPSIGPLRGPDTHFSVTTVSDGDVYIYSSDQFMLFIARHGDFSPPLDSTQFHANTPLTFIANSETIGVDVTLGGSVHVTQAHAIEQLVVYTALNSNTVRATYTAKDYNAAGSSSSNESNWGPLPIAFIVLGLLMACLALFVGRKRHQVAPPRVSIAQGPVPPPTPRVGASPPRVQETPLRNERWLGLAESCATLFDDLDAQMSGSDVPRQQMARHVENRLREILIHSGVEVIARDRVFDVRRHQLDQASEEVAPGTPIAAFVSPGFAVEDRVLRRAIVRTASAERA